MTEFCALRAKAYAYKLNDNTEMKKAKGTKKCIVKRGITFKKYADALLNDDVIIRSQQRFRSDQHRVYTEEVNKIALSGNDDKRIQTFDKVTTYSYGTNTFKVCENDVRYVILKNKSQTPGNDSQILRNDLQILRKESQILRNKSQILRNESQALRKESQIPRNKSQILRIKSQILRNKSQILRNKSQALRSDHQSLH